MEKRLERWLERFPEADSDGDGELTVAEARAYREERREKNRDRRDPTPEPTRVDVAYGPHERNRFDVWVPEKSADDLPFPVLVYFHGGGFVGGDKSRFDPTPYLEAGIACVSANYRLVDGENTLSPIPFQDAARAVQTVRHRASEWNLDRGRVAFSGGSAGAVITLWLGYHDDLADPDAADPIARESTRADCLVPINGPTNLMPDWILENIGGSESVHPSYAMLFGEPVSLPLSEGLRARIAEISPWERVSPDDPPTLLVYSRPLDETPLPETASAGKVIHHPRFGEALAARLDDIGVENELRHGFDPRGSSVVIDFLRSHFAMVD